MSEFKQVDRLAEAESKVRTAVALMRNALPLLGHCANKMQGEEARAQAYQIRDEIADFIRENK